LKTNSLLLRSHYHLLSAISQAVKKNIAQGCEEYTWSSLVSDVVGIIFEFVGIGTSDTLQERVINFDDCTALFLSLTTIITNKRTLIVPGKKPETTAPAIPVERSNPFHDCSALT